MDKIFHEFLNLTIKKSIQLLYNKDRLHQNYELHDSHWKNRKSDWQDMNCWYGCGLDLIRKNKQEKLLTLTEEFKNHDYKNWERS